MSTDDLGWELFDDQLGHRLRDAAPPSGDPDATLDALRPRLERARRRRRAGVVMVSGLGGAAVVALALVLVTSGDPSRVRTPPATRPVQQTTTTTVHEPRTISVPGILVPGVDAPGVTGPGPTTVTTDDHGGNPGPDSTVDGGGGKVSDESSGSDGSSGSGDGGSGTGDGGSDSGDGASGSSGH